MSSPSKTTEELQEITLEKTPEQLENGPPYSVFTGLQKSFITYAASVSAMFSGLSSFIYYPAITALANSLTTSTGNINLTITAYLLMAGLTPSIIGDCADRLGRRPISIFVMALYLGANLGLAIQSHYVALLVLRCVQSAGASSTIALAYGIISDISTPAERGSYMGVLMGFTNAAPSVGPVLGGIITEKLSWHWIFWLLSILSAAHLLGLLLFLPETSPNRPNFIVIVAGGLQYTVFGCLAASLSAQMIVLYSLDYLAAGLVYLPSGISGILAAYLTGKLLDYEYRRTAQKYGLTVSKSTNEITDFPIEEVRLHSVFYFITISTIATVAYGWTLQARTHIAAPIVMQFITGGASVAIFVICGGLLTDLNPDRSATVQASYNLIRCALGGAGVAVLQAISDTVGAGWCFTIYAAFSALCLPLLLLLKQRGHLWRKTER
ncbi:MAG: hypothetical protein LQ342_004002 [Letrouitia transgressa]|nr:MAG: hypothetical protein LQ342_004002 [Letrouitia transgressa]